MKQKSNCKHGLRKVQSRSSRRLDEEKYTAMDNNNNNNNQAGGILSKQKIKKQV